MVADRRQFLQKLGGMAALSVTAGAVHLGNTRRLKLAAAVNGGEHDRLQPDWYRAKIRQVQEEMKKRKIQALLLLNATNIIYTLGYFHLPTERPLAAFIPESGEPALFVPELESDQVKLWWVKDYESYFDYPGPVNRIRWIFERVAKRGFGNGRDRGGGTRPESATTHEGRCAQGDDRGRRGHHRQAAVDQRRSRTKAHAPRHVFR